MTVYIVTIWNAADACGYLAADDRLTACEACAMRFIDPVTAETAATRAISEGWAFEIEEMEL